MKLKPIEIKIIKLYEASDISLIQNQLLSTDGRFNKNSFKGSSIPAQSKVFADNALFRIKSILPDIMQHFLDAFYGYKQGACLEIVGKYIYPANPKLGMKILTYRIKGHTRILGLSYEFKERFYKKIDRDLRAPIIYGEYTHVIENIIYEKKY